MNYYNHIKNDINVEKERNKFIINQLKLTHYYLQDGEYSVGSPISTSIELKCNYNFETQEKEWKKIITHTYCDFNDSQKFVSNISKQDSKDLNKLILELEQIDLRDLKNNYYTDEESSYWELEYNNRFKICGTYDYDIDELNSIIKLLDFRNILKQETGKIKQQIEQKMQPHEY